MHSFKETRIIKHNMKLISQVIMDVEKYPEFLPWCSSASILSEENNLLIAELKVSFKGFSEGYVSQIVKKEEADSCIIFTEAISGPFRFLKSNWYIKSLGNESEVNFAIDFEFKSTILDMIMGAIFSIITAKMVLAFEEQVERLASQLV